MNDWLKKLNLLDKDDNVSITNIIVFIFVAITAFKSLFSGVTINSTWFDWKIEGVDTATTLPLLFSLLNYAHKRVETNKKVC